MQVTFSLSHREQEVYVLLMEGLCDKEIADRLIIEPTTVKVHVRAIALKLGLTGRNVLRRHAKAARAHA